ncbi:type IV pilin biogenesis protein [Bythopirellula goksoeyrii]|uniref:Type IV pilin biogenesis protein n=2 Tax=Bythopirellula goksoeyrii TaxID=1400387 RepID=A0A5B9QA95_9BACT|nr:type IV pilin biogenesis protein [Bythopirellula goksoeyrii]
MLEFEYQALNSEGQSTSGRIAAESAALAIAELEKQGLAVQALRQLETTESAITPDVVLPPAPQDDCERVLRERVGQLIAQRDVLGPALLAFAAEMPAGRPRREIQKLATQLNEGVGAEEIVRGSDLSVLLPLLGDDAMQGSHRSLDNLLAESALRNRTRTVFLRTFSYPLIVLLVAGAVLIFLGAVVVPTFSDIYDDFDLQLPGLTKGSVLLSKELLFHPLRLLAEIAILVGGAYLAFNALRYWGLPGRLLGDITSGNSSQVTSYEIFTRTLAESLSAGFSLSCALRLAGQSSNQRWLRKDSESLAVAAQDEWCLPETVVSETRLPATVAHALRAGPSGAPSLPLLREVAEMYAERVRNRLDWSTGFIPQFTILLVGLVVAGVVFALYLPLVTLIKGLTG